MGITIEKITVKNCGPIKDFNQKLKRINLIYSKNEGGKSLLVEFIIRSIFRNKNDWGYLREVGEGKVTILGIEKNPIDFSPSSKKKLEDFIKKDERGLPISLVKLLVVKEGETEIVRNNKAGINKETIKDLLSFSKILDNIENKIKFASGVEIEGKEIHINKKCGIGKNYHEKCEELQEIERVLENLNREFEQGTIKDLKLKEEVLRQEKDLLLKAKRFKAYKLQKEIEELEKELNKFSEIENLDTFLNEYEKYKNQYDNLKNEVEEIAKQTDKIQELEEKKNQLLKAKYYLAFKLRNEIKNKENLLKEIPEEEIDEVKENVSRYQDKKQEAQVKREKVEELKEKSKDYEWLKVARENYDRFIRTTKINNFIIWIITFYLAGMTSILLNYKWVGLPLLLLSGILGVYYFKKVLIKYKIKLELENIKSEFRCRFKEELQSITQLDFHLEQQKKYYNQLEVLEEQLNELEKEIKFYLNKIQEGFKRIKIDNLSETDWNIKLMEIKNEKDKLKKEIELLQNQLFTLKVNESDYILQDPGIEYNEKELTKIENELFMLYNLKKQEENKIKELENLESKLKKIKNEIENIFKNLTGKKINELEWNSTFNELKNECEKVKKQINKKRGELEGLGITHSEYIKDDPGKEFSSLELEEVEKELEKITQKIKDEEEKFTKLKTQLIKITDLDLSSHWNELINGLYVKLEEVQKEWKEIKAEIIAGKIVYDIIQKFRLEEDKKLTEGLNSPEIKDMINKLTKRYICLNLGSAEVTILDNYNEFKLEDLSTGAREQVMLALRIGFLKRLFKQDSAFLILDDAFQHSDYEKRPILVKTLHELATLGWQIIYLTMDDNIKDLFNEEFKKWNEEYLFIHLL